MFNLLTDSMQYLRSDLCLNRFQIQMINFFHKLNQILIQYDFTRIRLYKILRSIIYKFNRNQIKRCIVTLSCICIRPTHLTNAKIDTILSIRRQAAFLKHRINCSDSMLLITQTQQSFLQTGFFPFSTAHQMIRVFFSLFAAQRNTAKFFRIIPNFNLIPGKSRLIQQWTALSEISRLLIPLYQLFVKKIFLIFPENPALYFKEIFILPFFLFRFSLFFFGTFTFSDTVTNRPLSRGNHPVFSFSQLMTAAAGDQISHNNGRKIFFPHKNCFFKRNPLKISCRGQFKRQKQALLIRFIKPFGALISCKPFRRYLQPYTYKHMFFHKKKL